MKEKLLLSLDTFSCGARHARPSLAAHSTSAGSSVGGGSWSVLGSGSFSVILGSDQRFSERSQSTDTEWSNDLPLPQWCHSHCPSQTHLC